MNHTDRINQLEKHIKDAQDELKLLKADIAKGEEVDLKLPMGGAGWSITADGEVYGADDWRVYSWVFKSEEEAKWTQRHELAWRKLRYYADKLNPGKWKPQSGDLGYCISQDTRVVYIETCVYPLAYELVIFYTYESAERALKELGDDVDYLWSWKRKPEERAR